MNAEILERRFSEIGAAVEVRESDGPVRLNIRREGRGGETFLITGADIDKIKVVDVRRDDRHLLLMTESQGEKSKFLCGHDERHWFVAAIPETARGVVGVRQAKDALQPRQVQEASKRVRKKARHRRRNGAFVRQGEWFFVPEPDLVVDENMIFRNEPLSRGRGTSHILEYAYRTGGRSIYVSRNGETVSADAWAEMSAIERRRFPTARIMDPNLYAKGRVSHPDHATITLDTWHRVLMNTERGARAMRHVAFID
jgi:hypothetical protein